ncbi:MAG: TOBE domain-containing protein [Burkholderiales bacterium]|nr:TOBE domain-containing protein [Burkholderiales bacterium]
MKSAGDGRLLSADLKLAGRLDARFFALLAALEGTGSIKRAAATAGLSYKGAWLMLEAACNLANEALLHTTTGGAGGGGTSLTPPARALLAAWRVLEDRQREFLRRQEAEFEQLAALQGLLRRMSMRTSARNQFAGRVRTVEFGAVTAEVSLALGSGELITATLTCDAARRLGLVPGAEALALIKSSDIVLANALDTAQVSARNRLDGVVSRLEREGADALAVLTLPGGTAISASLAADAIDALGLAVGRPATALFKAYAVMLATRA